MDEDEIDPIDRMIFGGFLVLIILIRIIYELFCLL